ncbi:MAG: hypothetical protein RL677_327, partial [Actinomycetota bacterium]
ELQERKGDESFSVSWLTEQLREFVDQHPEFEIAIERLATRLARSEDEVDTDWSEE